MFLLRALQVGLRPDDLDYLDYGTVTDLLIERGNDDYEYPQLATQEDYDAFLGR